MRRARVIVVLAASVLLAGCNIAWGQFGGEQSHQSDNTGELAITASNVASLTQKWQVSLPAVADGAPAIAFGVSTSTGTRDLILVTTRTGTLNARDLHTGASVWSIGFPAGTCKINNGATPCYTTSSPVIDQPNGFAYTYGLDGKVHRVVLGTGVEDTTAPWPVVATLKPWDEKGSSALALAAAKDGTTYLYAANAGYPGDGGDYQGHITAIDLATGASQVFNTLCSSQTVHFAWNASPDCTEVQSGVWARSGVTYSSVTDLIYFVTGNATYDPVNGHWGDTVLAVHPDGTGVNGGPVDTYTPTNYQQLDDFDIDLGSTLPAIAAVPAGAVSPTGRSISQVGIQGGKDGMLRLLDLGDLSGQGGPGHLGGEWSTIAGPGGVILTAPAVYKDSNGTIRVFVGTSSGLAGYTLTLNPTTHVPVLTQVWKKAVNSTSPMVAGNVVYATGATTMGAYSPIDGSLLWSTAVGSIHWESPVVDGGFVILSDGAGHLTEWGL
jgi:hypothetical protein